ncbi:hypothetical protein [Kribbella sp. NPDC023855]|uniref:hypothetical protein n=1 Tax=Kribbella sp. NPDC023855 TaxID=3154698 RepID=UPI0033C69C87
MSGGEAGGAASPEERWLHAANAEAAVFYRQELLRTSEPWPAALLRAWGVETALDLGSAWQVGYAPDSGTRLMDHLQKKGFGRETMMRAGLVSWTGDGVVDRYRDQLVVVSRDRRLDPVGFVGIDRGGAARVITPETPVHRSSAALAGVLEQIDLLEAGATAVLVDHPLDAIGIDLAVRYSNEPRHVGIPLIGSAVSTAQAQILHQYSTASRVIVTVPGHLADGERAIRNAIDLTQVFDNVRLLQRPAGPLLANPGRLRLLADLVVKGPETGRRGGRKDSGNQHYYSSGIEDSGPSLN